MTEDPTPPSAPTSSFEERAASPRRSSVGQVWDYLSAHKKWWLLPLILVLLAVAGLLIAGSTGAGPLIYTFF